MHGRSGLIGPVMTSAGAIVGVIMVMLAWVGVNLLGIGLHSYGFTYTGLGTLLGVSLFETTFLLTTIFIIRKRRQILLSKIHKPV